MDISLKNEVVYDSCLDPFDYLVDSEVLFLSMPLTIGENQAIALEKLAKMTKLKHF